MTLNINANVASTSTSSHSLDDIETGFVSKSCVVSATDEQRTIVETSDVSDDDNIIKPQSRKTATKNNARRYSLSLFLALFLTTAVVTIANGLFVSYHQFTESISLLIASWNNEHHHHHHHLDSAHPSSSFLSSSSIDSTTSARTSDIKINKYVPLTSGNDGKIHGYVLQEVGSDETKISKENTNVKWIPLTKPNDTRIYGYHWVSTEESSSLAEQRATPQDTKINRHEYVPLTKNDDGKIYGYFLQEGVAEKSNPNNTHEGKKHMEWEPLTKASDNRIYGYVLQEQTGNEQQVSKSISTESPKDIRSQDHHQELEVKLSLAESFNDDDSMPAETPVLDETKGQDISSLLSSVEYIDDDAYWTKEEKEYISSTTTDLVNEYQP